MSDVRFRPVGRAAGENPAGPGSPTNSVELGGYQPELERTLGSFQSRWWCRARRSSPI